MYALRWGYGFAQSSITLGRANIFGIHGRRVRFFDLIQCGEPQSSSASRFTAGAFGFLTFTPCPSSPSDSPARPRGKHGTRSPLFAIGGSSSLIWLGRLRKSEQVGGRAHEAQFGFVWSGGSAAYRNGGADGFSRDVFRRRCWQLEVLRHRWNRKGVLNGSASCLSSFNV